MARVLLHGANSHSVTAVDGELITQITGTGTFSANLPGNPATGQALVTPQYSTTALTEADGGVTGTDLVITPTGTFWGTTVPVNIRVNNVTRGAGLFKTAIESNNGSGPSTVAAPGDRWSMEEVITAFNCSNTVDPDTGAFDANGLTDNNGNLMSFESDATGASTRGGFLITGMGRRFGSVGNTHAVITYTPVTGTGITASSAVIGDNFYLPTRFFIPQGTDYVGPTAGASITPFEGLALPNGSTVTTNTATTRTVSINTTPNGSVR